VCSVSDCIARYPLPQTFAAMQSATLDTLTFTIVLLQPVVRKQHNSGFKHKVRAGLMVELVCTDLMCQLVESVQSRKLRCR
jgi:hypothetical protein